MFHPGAPKLSEMDFLRQLIGRRQFRGAERTGGLLRTLGVERLFHDEATNAVRQCERCKAELPVVRNAPGFPDLVFVAGRTLWLVELKSQRGKPTEPQRQWLAALRQVTRIRVAVWRPDDVDEIVREVRTS